MVRAVYLGIFLVLALGAGGIYYATTRETTIVVANGDLRVGTSIADMGAGMWAAMGILAALNRRHVTGEGCHVTTSLFETAIGWMTSITFPGTSIGAQNARGDLLGRASRSRWTFSCACRSMPRSVSVCSSAGSIWSFG